jgi:hypothetical protein
VQLVLWGFAALSMTLLVLVAWRYVGLRRRYASIIDVDAEVHARREALEREVFAREAQWKAEATARNTELNQMSSRLSALQGAYASAKSVYDRLGKEVALLEENLEDLSVGLYKPHFAYDSPDKYRAELERIRDLQKVAVRGERAVAYGQDWLVNNSKSEGRKMQKQQSKLMLRAFNGEVEAAIGKVSWSNVLKMEERIRKAFEQINQQGTVMHVALTAEYLSLALMELRLEHELEEKKREEAEEQRRIKEQMREEERALREARKAQDEAESEEVRFQKALEKARAEARRAHGVELSLLDEKVRQLEQALAHAHLKKERALSLAQQTRSGHVYIVSNIGSFGEDVFKIGMTRRLDPRDRIKELGDASVPFEFDVHAMLFAEDAPALENLLHRQFAHRRVNMINVRKEFFSVSIAEIEQFARQQGLGFELTKLAEAREYRETLAMRAEAQRAAATAGRPEDIFPEALPLGTAQA